MKRAPAFAAMKSPRSAHRTIVVYHFTNCGCDPNDPDEVNASIASMFPGKLKSSRRVLENKTRQHPFVTSSRSLRTVRATYFSKRPVASRSWSYRLVSGNGGNQDSRRTTQLS